MGAWLDRQLPRRLPHPVSPALRCVQTAEALGRKFKLHARTGAGRHAGDNCWPRRNWPDSREPVLVVGHQPTLGQTPRCWSAARRRLAIRKAGVWWIAKRARDDRRHFLRAVTSRSW